MKNMNSLKVERKNPFARRIKHFGAGNALFEMSLNRKKIDQYGFLLVLILRERLKKKKKKHCTDLIKHIHLWIRTFIICISFHERGNRLQSVDT